MYKISKYCIYVEDGDQMIVFNTLTSSLIRVEKDFYENVFVNGIIPENKDQCSALLKMGYLVDENTDENFRLKAFRRRYQYADRGLTSAVIAVTTECNARCYYCYENGIERKPMKPETADAIVDYIDRNSKSRSIVLQWFGGEPLEAVDIIDRIADGLQKKGIALSSLITTNGYNITPEILDKAKNSWHIKRFQIPIDALNEKYNRIKNYTKLYPGNDPFSIVIQNIHAVLDAGFHVNVRTNFNPNEIETTREVLRFLAGEFKGESKFFAYPEPITGVGMASVVDGDYTGRMHPYLDLLMESRKLGFLCPTLLKEDDYLEGDDALSGIKLTSRPTGCYATLLNTAAIDSEGKLYKCHRQLGRGEQYSVGDVYKGICYNRTLECFCDDTPCYDECDNCALMPLCHGGCKVKKEWYGGHNACIAVKAIAKDIIQVYAKELSRS